MHVNDLNLGGHLVKTTSSIFPRRQGGFTMVELAIVLVIAGIILAAGASTRFGEPKQLLRLKDKYLLEWVLDATLKSELNRIVLVLGYAHQEILQIHGEKLQHSKLSI